MTAAITLASMYGVWTTIVCITISLLVNLGFMLLSYPINYGLEKVNATGTIVRITGLIVTAVAMQMIFSGCTIWLVKIT
jgi:small neutral amino acid transporter SnatA (MarC family)